MAFYSDFADYYEAVFPFEEDVHAFLAARVPEQGRRILDVGCGSGHYCGRFAKAGHRVVGIDLDPKMIAVARRSYEGPDFLAMGMLQVAALPPGFDLVFCIGNVASHLPGRRFREFLGSVHRVLRPGGAWVFQVVNWDYVLPRESFVFPDTRVDVPSGTRDAASAGDGRGGDEGPASGSAELVFSRRYEQISDGRIRFLTRLTADGATVFDGDVWLHPMPTEEYLVAHEELGFELEGHFANFRGGTFDPEQWSSSVFVFRGR